jgi:hypothetical protein
LMTRVIGLGTVRPRDREDVEKDAEKEAAERRS